MYKLSIKQQVSESYSIRSNNVEDSIVSGADISVIEPATLELYDNGMIHACNQASAELFCCPSSELIGRHITRLLPQLVETALVQGKRANSYLRFLSRIGYCFKVVNLSGASFVGKLFFNDVEYLGRHYVRVIIRPVK